MNQDSYREYVDPACRVGRVFCDWRRPMSNPSKESQNEAWQLQKQDWLETARRLDELKAERDTVQGQFEALGEAYMDQERERDRLAAALREYGSHRNDCINFDIVTECDCGWRALLAEIEGEE